MLRLTADGSLVRSRGTEHTLYSLQKCLFPFLGDDARILRSPLVASAAVQFFDPLVEERFRPGVQLLLQCPQPLWNPREQVIRVRRLVSLGKLEQPHDV